MPDDGTVPQIESPEPEFIPSGAIWSCSSRCWQEGGPHDETCRETVLYRRRDDDA